MVIKVFEIQGGINIFIIFLGIFITIPYGLMLGWPSPFFSVLVVDLGNVSSAPITLDQSALVAGFLFLGYITSIFVPSLLKYMEYGVLIGALFMLGGWLVMWVANSFLSLIIARFLVGLGYGYALANLKRLIKEIGAAEDKEQILIKIINSFTFMGFISSFIIGPRVDFRTFSFISVTCSIIGVLSIILITFCIAKNHTGYSLNQEKNEDFFIYDLEVFFILKDLRVVKNLLKTIIIVLGQQYSGLAASLVYTQIIFDKLGLPHPQNFALAYATFYSFLFILCNFSETHSKLPFKSCILGGLILIILSLATEVAVLYCEVDKYFWGGTSFCICLLFCLFHTISLTTVSGRLIKIYFEEGVPQKLATNLYLFVFLIFALTGTKIFQVILGSFGIIYCFIFCLMVSISLFLFIIVFY